MKINTIKWRIFKYNILVIIMLITLVAIIFNIAVRMYIEKDILEQLSKIASRTEDITLRKAPGFFPDPRGMPPPDILYDDDFFRYYFMLDRSLREPLTVLNADYILLDEEKNKINTFPEDFFMPPEEFFIHSDNLLKQVLDEINKSKNYSDKTYLNLHLDGNEYISIIKPISEKNSFGLGWIIIYSSLEKVNQLQMAINIILFVILIFSAIIIVIFSSIVSKKISEPFSSLNQHIRSIAERNFDSKLYIPVDDELRELVNNINIMSEKLESYDKAQKTFLQNASHEFRTPLMSIQSYAEGIKYDVIESNAAVDIIISESKRMANLVKDLLYLSRLDAIEENYNFINLNFNELINNCIERMNGIAIQSNIKITFTSFHENIEIYADEEKLSRAIANVINNCIRYADNIIVISLEIVDNNKIKLNISDDGPGFEADELPNIFDRFFKGKKGHFGLGLSISKTVIERHEGQINAKNSESGALFIIELPII